MGRGPAIAALALTLSLNCFGKVCTPDKTIKDEGLQFVTNFIESLGWAKDGLNGIPDLSKNPTDLQEVFKLESELMLGFKRASENFECAATLMDPYAKSKIEPVWISATGSALAYRQLMAASNGLVKSVKDELNLKDIKQGDFVDKITDFTLQADKAWEALVNATVAATFAASVFPKSNEVLTTLNMTVAQRNTLNRRLEEIFGTILKRPKEDLQSTSDVTGYLLYSFINKPEWKFLDK
jgi:hypothetical protein